MMNEFDRCIDEWAELVAQRNATIAALEQRINDLETNLFAATATVASLEDKLATVERERDQARAVYDALLFSVHRKFPGETRHQTALRYIRQAEQLATDGQTKQALGEG